VAHPDPHYHRLARVMQDILNFFELEDPFGLSPSKPRTTLRQTQLDRPQWAHAASVTALHWHT